MWTIPKEINKIVRDLKIGNDQFKRLDEKREHKVFQDVKRHFLTNVDALFWWEYFRYEFASLALNEPYKLIADICPNDEKKVWFIPCEEESVYDTYPHIAIRVLDECPAFEYALADKKLKWMFIENQHNVLYATGIKAIQRLKAHIKERESSPHSSR